MQRSNYNGCRAVAGSSAEVPFHRQTGQPSLKRRDFFCDTFLSNSRESFRRVGLYRFPCNLLPYGSFFLSRLLRPRSFSFPRYCTFSSMTYLSETRSVRVPLRGFAPTRGVGQADSPSQTTVETRWDEKAGLRTGCGVRSQVIDVLKAGEGGHNAHR